MLVNGAAGMLITLRGRPAGLMAFTIVGGRITAVDGITDPHRLRRLVDECRHRVGETGCFRDAGQEGRLGRGRGTEGDCSVGTRKAAAPRGLGGGVVTEADADRLVIAALLGVHEGGEHLPVGVGGLAAQGQGPRVEGAGQHRVQLRGVDG